MKKIKIVALLARDVGLNVLQNVLIPDKRFEICYVISHKKLPKSEGGSVRPESEDYFKECQRHNIKLLFLDYPEAKHPEKYLPPSTSFDLLIVLSWRFILTKEFLNRFNLAINIHRGELPKYKGAEPVKQAVEAGEKHIEITAHQMVEEIDAGPTICKVAYNIHPCPIKMLLLDYVETIKSNLKPLYAPLVKEAIDKVLLSYDAHTSFQ